MLFGDATPSDEIDDVEFGPNGIAGIQVSEDFTSLFFRRPLVEGGFADNLSVVVPFFAPFFDWHRGVAVFAGNLSIGGECEMLMPGNIG